MAKESAFKVYDPIHAFFDWATDPHLGQKSAPARMPAQNKVVGTVYVGSKPKKKTSRKPGIGG